MVGILKYLALSYDDVSCYEFVKMYQEERFGRVIPELSIYMDTGDDSGWEWVNTPEIGSIAVMGSYVAGKGILDNKGVDNKGGEREGTADHVGVVVEERSVIHSVRGHGVVITRLKDLHKLNKEIIGYYKYTGDREK